MPSVLPIIGGHDTVAPISQHDLEYALKYLVVVRDEDLHDGTPALWRVSEDDLHSLARPLAFTNSDMAVRTSAKRRSACTTWPSSSGQFICGAPVSTAWHRSASASAPICLALPLIAWASAFTVAASSRATAACRRSNRRAVSF